MTKDYITFVFLKLKKRVLTQHFSMLLGLLSGFSVFYFLYFFEAYGIQKGLSYSGHSHLFRSIAFGLLTLVYLSIFETWIKPKWIHTKLIYVIAWYAGLVFLGSQLIFLLFNYFWNWQEWDLRAYALIVKEFPLMMVLPLSFYFAIREIFKPRTHEVDFLLFQSENGKDQLKIKLKDFMYATASENYVSIFYRSKEKSHQHLIRKPLKVLEEELKGFPEIERSHRSYLVNRLNIHSVKQLKAKVVLEINGADIPVSKNFQERFIH